MSGGHSFQFTNTGIAPIAAEDEGNFDVMPANPAMFRGPDQTVAAPMRHEMAKANRVVRALPPKKPLNVVKAAKARLREVNREIKRLRALETERDELQRLLAAAENKPRAIVRDIAAKRG